MNVGTLFSNVTILFLFPVTPAIIGESSAGLSGSSHGYLVWLYSVGSQIKHTPARPETTEVDKAEGREVIQMLKERELTTTVVTLCRAKRGAFLVLL